MVRVAILHVDALLRARLRPLVEARGLSVVEASSLIELADAADEAAIGLLLVDAVTLRDVGTAAIRSAVSGDRPHQHVPVVLLAERGDLALESIATDEIDELLGLPIEPQELALRLESALARRRTSDTVAVASHELRSPVHAIVTFLDLLGRSELSGLQREMVDGARTASRHLVDLVEDLLEHARLGQGPVVLDARPFSLRAIVSEATSIALEAARAGHVPVTPTVDDAVPETFEGDGPRVRQILINLLSNALKFAAKEPVRLHVRTSDTHVVIEVADDGPGVPEAARTIVFEPFRQADASVHQRFGGTGLGLAIARSLARRMGGDVVVRGGEQGGAVFVVTLELRAQGSTEARPAELPIALLADADALHRAAVVPLLERLGYRVTTVSEGVAALLFAIEEGPALVVVDAELPALGGFEVAERLRAAHATMPIIAFARDAGDEQRTKGLAAGVSALVAKPVVPLQLQRALRHATLPKMRPRTVAPEAKAEDDASHERAKIGAGRPMHEALRSILEAVEMHGHTLDAAIERQELGVAAEVARALRGAVAALNARGLENVLKDLEQAARAGDTVESRRAHGAWRVAAASLRQSVERFLERTARLA